MPNKLSSSVEKKGSCHVIGFAPMFMHFLSYESTYSIVVWYFYLFIVSILTLILFLMNNDEVFVFFLCPDAIKSCSHSHHYLTTNRLAIYTLLLCQGNWKHTKAHKSISFSNVEPTYNDSQNLNVMLDILWAHANLTSNI